MSSSASEQPRGDQVWSSSSPPRSSTPPPQPLVGGLIESLSFRSCGFGRAAVSAFEKEDLRARAALPQRLRAAVHAALRAKDPSAGAFAYVAGNAAARGGRGGGGGEVSAANPWFEVAHDDAPESPLVAFVNPRSGGRLGPVLKTRLQELIGEDQVFDLTIVKPSDFVQYVLGCLEQLADAGDHSAKSIRHNLRVMVAGGDGTVGWVLGCLGDLYVQNREPIPPVAVIPLGTGNDLSRSFGWDGTAEGELPETVSCFDGVFYNYFSIGMDAQVAYGFHQLRDEKPFLASGPLSNKLIYAGYTCKQGWFFTQCISDPELRGLTNIIRLSIKRLDSSEWENIPRGFVEAQSDDGLLEIFGLKQGWHASLVMVELISAKHIAQAAAIRLEIKGGQWRDAYMQMDGEPWKQPLDHEYSTFVDIKKVPYPSLIINGGDRDAAIYPCALIQVLN
uniref:Diacylglycerol kinase n=1 Tax=Oryza nivara TaxID=4536 RepID=A0A0E0I998_ORYNI